ncbi:hypothetical protein IL306_000413 [Fusarium sp. DS 682]|nr:hypothetical protein IL306_000413 [Fusarium sp. DS 682]
MPPTVFYARDKSPAEEHNGWVFLLYLFFLFVFHADMRNSSPRASIENDDDGEEEPPKVVSDLVDYESCNEEFESPEPDDAGQATGPEKSALSPEEEIDDEAVNAKAGPPSKRQRRAQVDSSITPRRSKRIASTASLEDEKASTVKMEKSVAGKRGRGRPPAKGKATSRKTEVVSKRSPGRPPAKKKVMRGESTTEWEVEKVLDVRFDNDSKQLLYQIKWKGFGNKENTWEPKKNLGKCLKLIRDFEKKH